MGGRDIFVSMVLSWLVGRGGVRNWDLTSEDWKGGGGRSRNSVSFGSKLLRI